MRDLQFKNKLEKCFYFLYETIHSFFSLSIIHMPMLPNNNKHSAADSLQAGALCDEEGGKKKPRFFVSGSIKRGLCLRSCMSTYNAVSEKKVNKSFMQEAINLANQALNESLGGPFGAVVVKNNEIIGRGMNQVTSQNNPVAHAETMAIMNACQAINNFSLAGCEIYTSCEPCPMCLGAIYWAKIDKIYFVANREDAASIGFDDNFIYKELALDFNKRKIPLIKMDSFVDEAISVFQKWNHNPEKISY